MRILHVSCQKPDSTGSGIYLSALVKAFAADGHDNAVICGVAPEDEPHRSLCEGTRIYPVRFNTSELPFPVCGMSDMMPYESTRYRDLTDEQLSQFRAAFAKVIQEADAGFQPDLVICHHLYYLTALTREALPHRTVVGISHATDLRQYQQHDLGHKFISEQIPKLDSICALSIAHREDILRLFDVDPDKVKVIGTGYDPELFNTTGRGTEQLAATASEVIAHASGEDASSWRNVSEPILLYVGKIGYKKGVLSLVRTLKFLKDAKVPYKAVFVGGHSTPEEYEHIRAEAEDAALPITFTGALNTEQLSLIYKYADVMVLPSFFEGIPLVMAEALACGCRVVATDLPGIRPFYDHFLEDACIRYVRPPAMGNVDTPIEEELPGFEFRLADALTEALMGDGRCACEDLSPLHWKNVANRLMVDLTTVA